MLKGGARMGKVLSTGTLAIDGEKIPYVYCQGELLPNSVEWNNYIEAIFGGKICIDDHGGGLQYALDLLKNEIFIRKSNGKAQF
jgi:hypothetical protein